MASSRSSGGGSSASSAGASGVRQADIGQCEAADAVQLVADQPQRLREDGMIGISASTVAAGTFDQAIVVSRPPQSS